MFLYFTEGGGYIQSREDVWSYTYNGGGLQPGNARVLCSGRGQNPR